MAHFNKKAKLRAKEELWNHPTKHNDMMNRLRFFLIIFFVLSFSIPGHSQRLLDGGEIILLNSDFTSFPDTGRSQGHNYDGVLYDAASHYSDNKIIVIIPKKLVPGKTPDLIFWFHGWRNSIDSSLSHFHLAEQFLASQRNAILILAETAKNSPDSYGGKLELPGIFAKLVEDIFSALEKRKYLPAGSAPGHIILAGHSGAYRVMAMILQRGGLPVCEVQLFDALYAEENIFEDWIKSSKGNRFINIYTNQGGTAENSVAMKEKLVAGQVSIVFSEEMNMNAEKLAGNRVIFIHSEHEHNDIIMQPDNFRFFLENSGCLKSISR